MTGSSFALFGTTSAGKEKSATANVPLSLRLSPSGSAADV